MSDFAERGTWRPGELRKVPADELLTGEDLATLSDDALVQLMMSRSNLDEERAREAIVILRDEIPENTMFERHKPHP